MFQVAVPFHDRGALSEEVGVTVGIVTPGAQWTTEYGLPGIDHPVGKFLLVYC